MILENVEIPDEMLRGISNDPILLSWLREVQNSVIEFDKNQAFAFKSGPLAFISAYIHSWNYGYSSNNDLYDTTPTNGITVLESGMYEIEAAQRANSTGDTYVGLALNGDRAALENQAGALYVHDHTDTLNSYTICKYVGFIPSGSLVTLGAVDATRGSRLFFGSDEYLGYIKIKRISAPEIPE